MEEKEYRNRGGFTSMGGRQWSSPENFKEKGRPKEVQAGAQRMACDMSGEDLSKELPLFKG